MSLRKDSQSKNSRSGDVNNQSGGVAITGKMRGNVIVGSERYSVEAFPSRTQIDYARLRDQPSKLLSAENQVVPFVLREEELKRLTSWREHPDKGSVLLIHGSGGQGKTRLASEFAEQCAKAGWSVERARHCSEPAFSRDAVRKQKPWRLVVVDYAERWPREDLLAFFEQEFSRQKVPTRVLLLARAEFWWNSMVHPLEKMNFSVDSMPLGALTDTPQQRREVFAQAQDRFAEVLGVTRPTAAFRMNLDDSEYGHILVLHMAALVVVDAHARGINPPKDASDLSYYLLGRERAHWATMKENERIETSASEIADAVYTATLTGPMTLESAVTVLQQAKLSATDVDARKLLKDHAVCYPPVDSASDPMFLMPLLPDRLGEDFLALHLKESHWSWETPRRLLSPNHDDELDRPYAQQALLMLVETARRWPNVVGEKQLYPLLREHPRLAVLAGGTTLLRLAENPEVPLDVLEAVEPHLPREPTANLEHSAVALVIYYRLAAVNPAAYKSNLAITLKNIDVHLSELRQRLEAVLWTLQVVAIYCRLAETRPAAYEPNLALSLTNLVRLLLDLGQREEAMAAVKEVEQIRQRLAR